MLKSFLIFILTIIFKIIILFFPFKSLSNFLNILFFSFIVHPLLCSMFKLKNHQSFSYFKNVKTALFSYSILSAFGVLLSLPFSVALKLNSSKFLCCFLASLQASLFLLLTSKFAFLPCLNKKNDVINNIFLSFKLTKKNYHKIFAVVLKTYFLIILIFPTIWAIKSYVKQISALFEESYGGDDGV